MAKKPDPEASLFLEAASQKKAENLVALDVRGLSSIADFFIIASGRTSRQVTAIAEDMQAYLKEKGRAPLGVEGMTDGKWVLMDYGSVVVHIFCGDVRAFYDLEGLWSDAPILKPPRKSKASA